MFVGLATATLVLSLLLSSCSQADRQITKLRNGRGEANSVDSRTENDCGNAAEDCGTGNVGSENKGIGESPQQSASNEQAGDKAVKDETGANFHPDSCYSQKDIDSVKLVKGRGSLVDAGQSGKQRYELSCKSNPIGTSVYKVAFHTGYFNSTAGNIANTVSIAVDSGATKSLSLRPWNIFFQALTPTSKSKIVI